MIGRYALHLSETSQKESVNFCLRLRFGKPFTTNKKAHGYTVSISAFLRSKFLKFCRFQSLQGKAKTLYINMLFNQLSFVLVCSFFWVDEGKDRQTLENVEQKSSKPYSQLALSGSG